jgi:hypothetical protein
VRGAAVLVIDPRGVVVERPRLEHDRRIEVQIDHLLAGVDQDDADAIAAEHVLDRGRDRREQRGAVVVARDRAQDLQDPGEAAGPRRGARHGRSIPSRRIRERSVLGRTPSLAAAPPAPSITQRA